MSARYRSRWLSAAALLAAVGLPSVAAAQSTPPPGAPQTAPAPAVLPLPRLFVEPLLLEQEQVTEHGDMPRMTRPAVRPPAPTALPAPGQPTCQTPPEEVMLRCLLFSVHPVAAFLPIEFGQTELPPPNYLEHPPQYCPPEPELPRAHYPNYPPQYSPPSPAFPLTREPSTSGVITSEPVAELIGLPHEAERLDVMPVEVEQLKVMPAAEESELKYQLLGPWTDDAQVLSLPLLPLVEIKVRVQEAKTGSRSFGSEGPWIEYLAADHDKTGEFSFGVSAELSRTGTFLVSAEPPAAPEPAPAEKKADAADTQVMLEVLVAEVDREAARALNLGAPADGKTARWVIEDADEARQKSFRADFGALLRADVLLHTDHAGRLAEPRLVVLNGQQGSFFSGGEQAVPAPGGAVQFEEYGTKLTCRPTVLADGTIRLDVEPEVSELCQTAGVTAQGTVVPGCSSQRVHAIADLPPGHALLISGPKAGGNRRLVVLVTPAVVSPAATDARHLTPERRTIDLMNQSEHFGPIGHDAGDQRGNTKQPSQPMPQRVHGGVGQEESEPQAGAYPSNAERRTMVLMNQSENLRQVEAEMEKFWMADQPSHLTPERVHGGVEEQGAPTPPLQLKPVSPAPVEKAGPACDAEQTQVWLTMLIAEVDPKGAQALKLGRAGDEGSPRWVTEVADEARQKSFRAVLEGLREKGQADCLNRTTITACNGQVADLLIGVQRPVPAPVGAGEATQLMDVGFKFDCRSVVLADGTVHLDAQPEFSDVCETADAKGEGPAVVGHTSQRVRVAADIPVGHTLLLSGPKAGSSRRLVVIVSPTVVRPLAPADAARNTGERRMMVLMSESENQHYTEAQMEKWWPCGQPSCLPPAQASPRADGNGETVHDLLVKCQRELSRGHYAAAEELAQQALARDRKQVEADPLVCQSDLLRRVKACAVLPLGTVSPGEAKAEGRRDEARGEGKAIGSAERMVDALMQEYTAAFREARYLDAAALAQRALEIDPDNAVAAAAVSVAMTQAGVRLSFQNLFMQGRYEEAKTAALQALLAAPGDARALAALQMANAALSRQPHPAEPPQCPYVGPMRPLLLQPADPAVVSALKKLLIDPEKGGPAGGAEEAEPKAEGTKPVPRR